jgi:predicted membrane-bound mannosyltransferase
MPLTVALHCSMVKKPQFVPPPPLPEYWAHHRVLSQGRAVAGVCVSSTVTSTSAAKTLVTERICKLPLVVFEITPCAIIYSSYVWALSFSDILRDPTGQIAN